MEGKTYQKTYHRHGADEYNNSGFVAILALTAISTTGFAFVDRKTAFDAGFEIHGYLLGVSK